MAYRRVPHSVISMPEIAELAGVRRPVVTTWRRRHADFPQPVRSEAGRPLFDAGEIVDWLVVTGRGERSRLEPDLRLHLIADLAADAAGGRRPPGARALVAALTSLVCLRYLDDEPLHVPDERSWRVVSDLRERAAKVDPDDTLLRAEVEALGADQGWLAASVDALVEAAWGCGPAYERILALRSRFEAGGVDRDAVSPAAAALAAGLSGAREHGDAYGEVCVADPAAGAGDLLLAVLDTLSEDVEVSVRAAEADPWLARLLRRRLVVRGIPEADLAVHGDPFPPGGVDADVLVHRVPYQPKEQRDAADPFAGIRRLTDHAPDRTAVVLGPADLFAGALPPYRSAWRSRNELLTGGRVEAVVSLPGGQVPYRPAYETALWVLRRADGAPGEGRVLLADVSDRPLTTHVVDELVWDVVTWRRDGHRPERHLRAYAAQVQVADLVQPRVALSTRRPAGPRDVAAPAQAVARVVELEAGLGTATGGDGAGVPVAAHRPAVPLHSGLSARQEPAAVPRRAVATLAREQTLVMRRGNRLAAGHVVRDGHHRVIGQRELCGGGVVGARTIDRQVLAAQYPRAALTEPGDVVVTLTPQLGAYLDQDGYAVVEFPARVLRVTADGRAWFTPRVLAALLAALPQLGHPAGRAEGAVRAPARLADLPLPLLPRDEVARLDGLLAAADDRRARARREIALSDELCRVATTGLADGTLTMAPAPGGRRD